MGRGKHKPWSHGSKREAYKERAARPGYPRGGYGIPHKPYAKPKRDNNK